MSLLGRKTFCLITGASRGIGKTIAAELSKKLAAESLVVLVARNQQGLEDTVARLKESCPNVTVVPVSIDLSQCDFNSLNLSELIQGQSFDLSMLIHNAGTISNIETAIPSASAKHGDVFR